MRCVVDRSEVDGDALLFPVTITGGVRPVSATQLFRQFLGLGRGFAAAFFRFGQGALGGRGQVFAVVSHDIGFLSVHSLDIRPRPPLAMRAQVT